MWLEDVKWSCNKEVQESKTRKTALNIVAYNTRTYLAANWMHLNQLSCIMKELKCEQITIEACCGFSVRRLLALDFGVNLLFAEV